MDPSLPRFVVLGNPESNRVAFFQEALEGRGLAPALVVPWEGFLRGQASLGDALTGGTAVLRIESPGKNSAVERELIALGAEGDLGEAERLDPDAARALTEDKGRIRCLRQQHQGFLTALGRVEAVLAQHPVSLMNSPEAIRIMFDKRLCHTRLAAAGVSVPRALEGVSGWDDLREKMKAARMPRVFVKVAHGSSASGVVALATQGLKLAARTSVELVREGGQVRLYNSRSVRRYGDEADVRTIIDALAREGVHVEEWIPKASLNGLACDLRLVVVAGRAQHAVVRTSETPMTNLHLLNPRGDLQEFVAMLGEERWSDLQRLGEAAALAIPGALYAGVDLCVARKLARQAVLEANAFGDLLPRVMVAGRDTYTAELDAVLEAA